MNEFMYQIWDKLTQGSWHLYRFFENKRTENVQKALNGISFHDLFDDDEEL